MVMFKMEALNIKQIMNEPTRNVKHLKKIANLKECGVLFFNPKFLFQKNDSDSKGY